MEFRIHFCAFLAGPSSFDWNNSNINALDSVGCGSQLGKSLLPSATFGSYLMKKLGWLAIVGMLVAVLGVAMVVQRPQSQSKAGGG